MKTTLQTEPHPALSMFTPEKKIYSPDGITIKLNLTRRQASGLAIVARRWPKECRELSASLKEAMAVEPCLLEIEINLNLSIREAIDLEFVAHHAYKLDPDTAGTFGPASDGEAWALAARKAAWPKWEALWQVRCLLKEQLNKEDLHDLHRAPPQPPNLSIVR